ncbi:hypothetical protein OTU49_004504, partial [Cherax quadricarinatus]
NALNNSNRNNSHNVSSGYIDSDEKIEGKLTFSYIQEQYAEKSNRLIRVNLTYSDKDLLETDTRLGSYELRVTLVWAPGGTEKNVSFQDPSSPTNKVTKLKEWMQAEHIPDVIVIGFGSWLLLMREGDDELSPFPELSRLGHSLVSTLKYLATRTRVLFLSQSRYRWFNFENRKQEPAIKFWKRLFYLNQFRDGLPMVDAWLWRILRSVDALY